MSVSTILTSKRTISAIACSLSIAAMAATPVAVWDGDFTTLTKGTFTLSENGNTKTDSYLQISGDNGITVTSTDALNVFTVIMRCEGLNLSSANKQVLFTSYARDEVASNGTDYKNLTGVNLPANNAVCRGIWSAADWNDGATQGSVPANYTTLIYNHQQTNGTYGYALGPTSSEDETVVRTTLYSVVGLRSSGTTYHGFNIGGLRGTTSSTLLPATGLKITSIAVFSGTLTESEMKAYFFPSEIQQKAISVEANTTLSAILAETGITSEASARTALTLTATDNPTITIDQSVSLYSLTINGAATVNVDSSLYDDGCFKKTIVGAVHGGISAADATFTANCNAWKGALKNAGTSLELYAQNTETISINIGGGSGGTAAIADSPAENLVSGSGYCGLYPTPGNAWNNISGRWSGSSKTVTLTGAKAFDGETTTTRPTVQLSGTANNTYQWGGVAESFLRGYLDDTGGVSVQIVGVPYSEYDVIVYATSDSSLALNYFTINGSDYTCGSDGIATVGQSSWGEGETTTAQLGKNAMLVQGVTGSTLTVSGSRAAGGGSRVTVCAVQIINKGIIESSDWTANLDATTTFSGGVGAGLSGQSGTWANNALASIIITNKASDVTLTLDGEITAGVLKVVGGEGKRLSIDKDSGATLDIAVYDLTESAEEAIFLFNPDFSKVNAGANLVGVGYDHTGTIGSGFHYIGSANTLTLGTVDGSGVNIGGGGTITTNLDVIGGATVTLSGTYTTSGFSRLGATKGVVVVDSGADVTFTSVMLANSNNGENYNRLDVNGTLRVSSVSTTSNVYNKRNDYEGILFGHWKGTSTVNVGAGGSILAENAWMQLSYSTNSVVTINGGAVKVAGINGGPWATDFAPELTLTGGGCLEFAESPINMDGVVRNYGYGTIKTYSYNGSTGWTDPGAITFTDATNGTTIDPCGMTEVFSGALSGAGKIVVSDSVGGGSVSFTGDANDLSGDIVVAANTTLNLGTARPTGTMTVNGTLAVVLINKADVPVFKVSANPVSVILYDTDGETVLSGANVEYDADEGTITVKSYPIWATETESGSVDTAANWSTGSAPASGDAAIVLAQDTTISISGTYTLSSLTISGAGEVTFSGEGSITAANIYLENGAKLKRDASSKITATTGISLASGTVLKLDGITESAVISGAGAVETYGNVVLAAGNTLTGGITVKSGSRLSTNFTPVWDNPSTKTDATTGYGRYNKNWAATSQRVVTVEDGGCVDINNVANKDCAVALCIAGKGILSDGVYSGSVVYTGSSAIGNNSRQISNLSLTADALVDLGAGWGLVHSGHENACLALNGHTLTLRGSTTTPMVKVNVGSGTTGTLLLDGASLMLSDEASNLTNVNIVAKGCATINLATAPSAIGSLTLKPSASGTTASSWNLPSGFVPAVDTSNIDAANLTVGQELTLFTAPSATELTAETISVAAGGRYTVEISGNTVTATVNALAPFLHDDFNGEATLAGAKASDSVYEIPSYGNHWPSKIVAKNGYAALIDSGHVPWWNTISAGVSPFHAGEMSVLALIRPKAIDSTVRTVWNLGSALENGIALVVKDSSTLALVGWTNGGSGFDIAVVSGIEKLEGKWHFVAIVTSENGTLLYVDDMVAFSETVVPQGIAQKGQFGSVHSNGNSKGYYGQNDAGFLLDDWRVYDAALTAKEVKALKRELNPDPLFIRLR